MFNVQAITIPNSTFDRWANAVTANGGTFTSRSKTIAKGLSAALTGSTFLSKIRYLLPLLGGNLAAARTPMIDASKVGIATNTSFVEADFSETVGLTGNGTNKYLTIPLNPSQLGSSNNGSVGFWLRNSTALAPLIGTWANDNGHYWGIAAGTTNEMYLWGDGNTFALSNAAAGLSLYHFRRASSTDMRLFKNGVSLLNSSLAGNQSGITDQNIKILAAPNANGQTGNQYSAGVCAVAYAFDGTETDAEIAALYVILNTYLILPTGR